MLTGAPKVLDEIPRIDRSVEHVGVSRLRKLNSEELRNIKKTLVFQENDQPLAVLLTYDKYMLLQDHLDALTEVVALIMNTEESAALMEGLKDLQEGRIESLSDIKAALKNKRK